METLQRKKQRAKQLFKNEQFMECKQLLLDIISEGNGHYKLLMQLGNVCIELNEYANAKNYYEQSIKENPNYSLVYCKLGILLSEYLNEYDLAIKMFNKCIQLNGNNNNNDLCYFNYGKLMYKLRNYNKSKQYYLKCNNEAACLHYHFAKLLLTISSANLNEIQTAKLKLESATKIKPNNSIYHYEYAKCLQKLKQYELANAQFLLALQCDPNLSNHKRIQILYDYSNLLSLNFNYHKQAIEQVKIAYELDTQNEYPHVKDRYFELKNWLQTYHTKPSDIQTNTTNIQYDPTITLIVYGFNENISYWSIHDMKMTDLQSMTKLDTITNIFGGSDRVNRLKQHFQRILSSPNNIKLAIICHMNKTDIIAYALKKVQLYNYFSDYISNGQIIETDKFHLQKHIIDLSNLYNLNISQQLLFVDSTLEHMQTMKDKCKTYETTSDYLLNGLSMQHMHEIESIVDVDIPEEFSNDLMEDTDLNYDMREYDKSVYDAIKLEIIRSHCKSIYLLPVIKYIHSNWSNNIHKQRFVFFADKYKQIRCSKSKYNCWTRANILPQMLKLSPNDPELYSRYAACLATLQHYDTADHYFKLSMKKGNPNIVYHTYAYFLFDQERYVEAETYFLKSIDSLKSRKEHYFQSCLGYARTLEYLEQPSTAEKYYKIAIQCGNLIGKMQYFFGIFLFNHKRYNEAKIQFKIAMDYYPQSATNHYWYSKTLVKLDEFDESNFHIKEAHRLDPHFRETISEFNRYHYETFDPCEINSAGATVKSTGFDTRSDNMFETEQKHMKTPAAVTDQKQYYVSNPYLTNTGYNPRGTRSRGDPLLRYSERINPSNMEKHRNKLTIIAENEYKFPLDKLHHMYYDYFNGDIRSFYHGKMKNLIMYFNDIFELQWRRHNNKIYMISKIYNCVPDGPQTMASPPQTKMRSFDTNRYSSSRSPSYEYMSSSKMETFRDKMEQIAENASRFHLSQFKEIYSYYNNKIYPGKVKDLLMHFDDLFRLEYDDQTNFSAISKIHSSTKCDSGWTENKNNDMNELKQNVSEDIVLEKNQIEFDRFWFDELGIISKEFNKYYDNFVDNNMNDIRNLFDDNIQSMLQNDIKVKSLQDLQLIMTNIQELRKENNAFKQTLKTDNLYQYHGMFISNAIFTINALKYHIQSEDDIKQMIELYILNNDKDRLMSVIWKIVTAE